MNAPRVLFYVQHLLGIGHLVRASHIAGALAADGFSVAVISGGVPVPGFPGPNIELIGLPPVKAADEAFSALIDLEGQPVGQSFWVNRRMLLTGLLKERQPDIVIIEAFPFGRRQMRSELLPFLEAAKDLPSRPLIACSVRDILQENRKAGRAMETVETVKSYFDRVLVHGDRTFARLDETFPEAREIGAHIAYTGLVAGPEPEPPKQRFEVVVSAGGGAAGARLLGTSLAAGASLANAAQPWCIITGPNIALDGKVPPHVRLETFRPDFPSLLAGARLSISQAGYNTVCDILRAGCRSVLVPFAAGGETEQSFRAGRLASLGLASVLPEATLDSSLLIELIAQELGKAPSPHHDLDLDGARRTVEILRRDLASKRARSA